MLHVRTFWDTFLSDVLMNLRKLLLLFTVFQIDKNIAILTVFNAVI